MGAKAQNMGRSCLELLRSSVVKDGLILCKQVWVHLKGQNALSSRNFSHMPDTCQTAFLATGGTLMDKQSRRAQESWSCDGGWFEEDEEQ